MLAVVKSLYMLAVVKLQGHWLMRVGVQCVIYGLALRTGV
jgi:hypothetical protein